MIWKVPKKAIAKKPTAPKADPAFVAGHLLNSIYLSIRICVQMPTFTFSSSWFVSCT